MAGKTTGGNRRKSAAKRTTSKSAKTRSVKSAASTRSRKTAGAGTDKTPVYVLAIMALLAVIVIMLINNYRAGENFKNAGHESVKEPAAMKDTEDTRNKKGSIKKADVSEDAKDDKYAKEKSVSEKKEAESQYLIYLVKFNEDNNRMSLLPVKRNIKAESPLKGALNELIKGPNRAEKKKGLLTAIPNDLRIRNVQIVGRNAVLDFNDAIETNANGEILLTRVDQLVYTATQFEGVDSVIIKVNGKQKKFLGGDGLSVSGPIGRKGK